MFFFLSLSLGLCAPQSLSVVWPPGLLGHCSEDLHLLLGSTLVHIGALLFHLLPSVPGDQALREDCRHLRRSCPLSWGCGCLGVRRAEPAWGEQPQGRAC